MSRHVRIGLIQFASIHGGPRSQPCQGDTHGRGGGRSRLPFIICFPEAFTTGYHIPTLEARVGQLAEPLDGPTVSSLADAARRSHLYVIAPLILLDGPSGTVTNSAVVIDPRGEVMGVYSKNHLWPPEAGVFTAGDGYPVFDTSYGRVGIMICYDANFPEPARILALLGAELIFMPCAWRIQDKAFYDLIVPARAMDNQLFVAAVNAFGMQGDLHLFGNSKVADCSGRLVAESVKGSEEILVVDLDLDQVTETRAAFPLFRDRRPGQYREICRAAPPRCAK